MLTMRPKPRAIMPSTVSRIISMWHSIMVSSASIQSSRVQLRKSPGRRPSALLTRISGAGHAAITAARPCGVVTSAATGVTATPVAAAISRAVAASAAEPRATMAISAPSRASAVAQALPRPRLAPQTMAFLPLMPRSTLRAGYAATAETGLSLYP
jgi:hypothetical protein